MPSSLELEAMAVAAGPQKSVAKTLCIPAADVRRSSTLTDVLGKAGAISDRPTFDNGSFSLRCSWLVSWNCSGWCREGPIQTWRQEC